MAPPYPASETDLYEILGVLLEATPVEVSKFIYYNGCGRISIVLAQWFLPCHSPPDSVDSGSNLGLERTEWIIHSVHWIDVWWAQSLEMVSFEVRASWHFLTLLVS